MNLFLFFQGAWSIVKKT